MIHKFIICQQHLIKCIKWLVAKIVANREKQVLLNQSQTKVK